MEDCNKISGHSLRIGSITQARMNGVPTHEIMAQEWSQDNSNDRSIYQAVKHKRN